MGSDILIEDNVIPRDIRDRGLAEGVAQGIAQGVAQGRAQGRAQGVAQGRATMLREILSDKFGSIPDWVDARLQMATPEELTSWGKRTMRARTIEDVFSTQ